MVSVSCFYCHYNRESVNFTFIQFKNFVKVCLNKRAVILTNKQLVLNPELFQIFKLSLLCTNDVSMVYSKPLDLSYGNKDIYGTLTKMYWKNLRFTKHYEFIEFEKSNLKSPKNPFNAEEPKRSTSEKKIRKFMKLLNSFNDKVKPANEFIREFLDLNDYDLLIEYFRNYIIHNQCNPQITILSQIYHNYGIDVYRSISRFM